MDKLIKISEIFNVTLDELIKEESINEKINNTNSQKLAGMVIKILKGLGIFLITLLILSILLIIIGLISFNKTSESNTTVVEVQEIDEVQFEE